VFAGIATGVLPGITLFIAAVVFLDHILQR